MRKRYKMLCILLSSLLAVQALPALPVQAADSVLTAIQPSDGSNTVNLDWPGANGDHYMVHKSEGGENAFQTIPLKSTIKVLNIYPDIAASDSCIGWMSSYGSPAGTGYTMSFDHVSLTEFNTAYDSWLKNSDGTYKYDVLYFGGYDCNNNLDLSDNAKSAVASFINYGGGCLLGHDTASFTHTNFISLATTYLNMEVDYANSQPPTFGDTKVVVAKKGSLMNFPYSLGAVGNVLTVPLSHSYYEFAAGDVWFNYQNNAFSGGAAVSDFNSKTGTNNFYLTTWNNMAMIQTGHSNGSATEDEQKILANTLYYLAQVSTSKSFEDHTSQDLASPAAVSGTVSALTDYTGHSTVTFPAALDNGSSYDYYLDSIDSAGNKTPSATTSAVVTTGIKGYAIIIDSTGSGDPGSTITSTSTTFDAGVLPSGTNYLNICAIDNAGNASEVSHIAFTVNTPKTPALNSALSTLPAIEEDTSSSSGALVSDLLSGKVTGDSLQPYGIAVTATDNTNGQWQYSMDSGTSWWALPRQEPAISEASALLLPSTARLRFIPALNFANTAAISYRAWDTAFCSTETRADTSINGEGTAFSNVIGGAAVTVNDVNDAPSILKTGGNKVLSFEGSTDDFMSSPDYGLNGSFTVEAWVYADALNNWSRIFDFGAGESNYNQMLSFMDTSGKMRLEIWKSHSVTYDDSQLTYIVTPDVFPTGQWVHVAAVYNIDTETGYIYWNGNLKVSGHLDKPDSTTVARLNNYFGKSNWSQDSMFQGKMNCISVWNTPRSQSQIQSDMNALLSGSEEGLISCYNLSEGSGPTAADSASAGNNAAINGLTWADNSTFSYTVSGIENHAIAIDKLQAADVDAADGTIQLALSVLSGSLTLGNAQDLSITAGENGSPAITVQGKLSAINNALSSLSYMPGAGFSGTDTLTAALSDLGCTGSGLAGTDQKTVSINVSLPVIPDAPYGLTAATDRGNATVSFNAPINDGGSAVTSYTVTATSESGGTTITNAGTASPITLSGLTIGETYSVVVTATNSIGTGPSSPALSVVSPPYPPVSGSGDSLSFNGSSYVDVSAAGSSLYLGSSFTEEAWIYPQLTDDSYHGFLGNHTDTYMTRAPGIWVYEKTKLHAGFGTGTEWVSLATGSVLTPNAWNHVAVTYDGSIYTIYVNGVAVMSQTCSKTPCSTPVAWIGKVDNNFIGKIDEVQLWTAARTQDEIKSDMYRHPSPVEANLAGYWNFDETEGTIAKDSSATGANGTFAGMTAASRGESLAWESRTTQENTSITFHAGYDPEGFAVTPSQSIAPSHGSLSFDDAADTVTYTPQTGWSGTDTFTYVLTDNFGQSDSYSISVAVLRDTLVPAIAVAGNPTTWTTGDASLSLQTTCGPSGIQSVTVAKDGGTAADITGASTYTVSENGSYVFTITSNEGFFSQTLVDVTKIDKTGPTGLTISYGGNIYTSGADPSSYTHFYSGDVAVSLSASDTGSGVQYYQYQAVNTALGQMFNANGLWESAQTFTVSAGFSGAIYARAVDNLGNASAIISSEGFVIDASTPTAVTVSASADGSAYSESWTKSDISIELSNSSALSGIARYEYKIGASGSWQTMPSKSGNMDNITGAQIPDTLLVTTNLDNTIYFRPVSNSGLNGPESSLHVRRDAQTPSLTVSTEGTLSAWTSQPVTFTLSNTAVQTAPIAYYVSQDGGNWTLLSGNTYTVSTNTDSVFAFRALTDANLMDTSANYTVRIDNIPPDITAAGNMTQWTNQDLPLSFSTSTGASGVSSISLSIDGAAPIDITGLTTVNASHNGTYIFTLVNGAGVPATDTLVVGNIDKTIPQNVKVNIAANPFMTFLNTITFGLFFNDTVEVSFEATDALSGVDYYEYQLVDIEHGSTFHPSGIWSKGQQFYVSPDFKGAVYARAIDKAGNISGIVSSNGFITDTQIPAAPSVLAISGGSSYTGNWTSNAVSFTLSGASTLSGIAQYEYKIGAAGTWQAMPAQSGAVDAITGSLLSDTLVINYTMDDTLYFRAVSNAGNVGIESSFAVLMDKLAPALSVQNTGTVGAWTASPVQFTLGNTAATLAPITYYVRQNGGSWTLLSGSSYSVTTQTDSTFEFRALSETGLESVSPAYTVRLDNTPPTLQGAADSNIYAIGRVIHFSDSFGELDTALVQKDGGTAAPFTDSALFSDPGSYALTVKDKAGNVSLLSFTVNSLPTLTSVVYTPECQALLSSLRAEFTAHTDLPDPYRSDTDLFIKQLEDKYAALDAEVGSIRTEITTLKDAVSALPGSTDGLIALKSDLQLLWDRIAGSGSMLTAEQQAALASESGWLSGQLAAIQSLRDEVSGIRTQANSINTGKEGLLSQRDTVQSLLTAISALTQEQQTMLQDICLQLESLINTMKSLQDEVGDVSALIDALPPSASVQKSDLAAIQAAMDAYLLLTNEQQALVGQTRYAKLISAASALAELMLYDNNTDTSVSGLNGTSFSLDTFLVVTIVSGTSPAVSEDPAAAQSAARGFAISNGKEFASLYYIALYQGESQIEPNGNVLVKIKIPQNMIGRSGLTIVRYNNDGTTTNMNAVSDGEYLYFITNHFSFYALFANPVPEDEKAMVNSKTSGAKTGDNAPILLLTVLLAVSAAAIVFFLFKRRKKH